MVDEPQSPEQKEILDQLEKLIPAHLRDQVGTIAPMLAAVNVTRSPDYRSIYFNGFRPRLGPNDVTVVINKNVHAPSLLAAITGIEEQAELLMTWPVVKMLSLSLNAIVSSYEDVIGEIPIPTIFKLDMEGHKRQMRSLGLPLREPHEGETPPIEQRPTRNRRKTK